MVMSAAARSQGRALLRWLASPGATASRERLPQAMRDRGARVARLASARLLRDMAIPICVTPLDGAWVRWLTARRERIESDLLILGAWLCSQALRRGVGGESSRMVAGEIDAERFVQILRYGPVHEVPHAETLDADRLRAIGLAAMHARLCAMSPAVAERFLLDQPLGRVRRMVEEAWVGDVDDIASTMAKLDLWSRHEPTD